MVQLWVEKANPLIFPFYAKIPSLNIRNTYYNFKFYNKITELKIFKYVFNKLLKALQNCVYSMISLKQKYICEYI